MTETPRYDMLIVCEQPEARLTEAAAVSVLRTLAARRVSNPVAESVARTWVEVYGEPGSDAHEIFSATPAERAAAPLDTPAFLESVVRWGDDLCEMPYGRAGAKTAFFIELRGALRSAPAGPFRQLLQRLLGMRPIVYSQPHVELPPHREVPEAERKPKARASTSNAAALSPVGTRVIEF